jgi:hypothetical protein
MSERLLTIGLDEPESAALRDLLGELPVIAHPTLPALRLENGTLYAESATRAGRFLPVSRVIFHGIFADDLDLITTLALWGGPCLPSARGLLDCRLRIPCLARALSVTRFGAARSLLAAGQRLTRETPSVAKWGNWHCGENKLRFSGEFVAQEATIIEPFFLGEAVRVVIIGPHAWQVRLEGDDWLKSIHHERAAFMPLDPALHEDTEALARALRLEMLGVDYIAAPDGARFLLEVNHIPNVTRFPELRGTFLRWAASWALGSDSPAPV